jgi:hypothetical protein
MKPHTMQRLKHDRFDMLTERCIVTGISRVDADDTELSPRLQRRALVLLQRQDAARSRRRRSRASRRWLAQWKEAD